MKIRQTISILLVFCFALTLCRGAVAAPEIGGEASFEYDLNMLRVYKNRFYNAAEAALSEDTAFAKHLYLLFDYVYGDAMLDLFAQCMSGSDVFAASLKQHGYSGCVASTDGRTRASAAALREGKMSLFTAQYSADGRSCVLRIAEGGALRLCAWRMTQNGCEVQYLYPDSNGGFYTGYRAAINNDGTGEVCCGVKCTLAAALAFTGRSLPQSAMARLAFGGDAVLLASDTVTVIRNGEEQTHTIGDIPGGDETSDGGEEP